MSVPAKDQMVKIVIPTESSGWHGISAERVWATPQGGDEFVLENSPLYASGLSYKDLVIAEQQPDGSLRFQRVSHRGGHSTYQILLAPGKSKADFESYWKSLEDLACTYESSRNPENVFAVDVPPGADIYEVYRLLERGEAAGVWEFGEAHVGHQLKS